MQKLDCPSLRSLLQYGFNTNYSSLKNYYTERRLLSKSLFEELCLIAKINTEKISYSVLEKNWGQIKGGKKSKRTKTLKAGKNS